MTREEEINQASKSYASQMCNICLDEYCKEKRLTCPQIREYEIAYSEGVKWADKHPANVWHDATEEPPRGTYILIETSFFKDNLEYYSHEWSTSSSPNWEEYVRDIHIKRWAYISDLLPKGGKK